MSYLPSARTVLRSGLVAIQDNLPPRKFRRGQQDNSYGYFYAADNSPLNILPQEDILPLQVIRNVQGGELSCGVYCGELSRPGPLAVKCPQPDILR